MMNYHIYEIHDLSDQKIVELLKKSISDKMFDNPDICRNYLYEYRNDSANLFYILKNGRYRQGAYFVITDFDNNFIASAGWNEYDSDTALILTRMIVQPEHRAKYIIGNHLLPKIIEQTKDYKKVWITANNYNKSIYTWFERSNQGKSASLSKRWPDLYKNFEPIGQHTVYNTLQWVVQLKK